MSEYINSQSINPVPDALKALREMPYHIIVEGKEDQYRKQILDQYRLNEKDITLYIDMNKINGISLSEHTVKLRQKAYEFRTNFRADVEKLLSVCEGEEEELQCLEEGSCNYTRWAYEKEMWQRHQFKSFAEFAQWHIEEGGWTKDFQEANYDDFAEAWAQAQISSWIGQQITEIGTRRFEESERQAKINSTKSFNRINGEGIYYKVLETEENEQLRLGLDQLRTKFIREKRVKKGYFPYWSIDDDDEKQEALKPINFIVKSIEDLREDLEKRFATSLRKDEFLMTELKVISSAIDDSPPLTLSITNLRQTITTNRPIDLTQFEDKYFRSGMENLAMYWDIIHYESYLKDRISSMKESMTIPFTNDPSPVVPKTEKTIDLVAGQLRIKNAISIVKAAQKELYSELIKHVDIGTHKYLKALVFKGVPPSEPIIISCSQKTFGLTFHTTKAVPDRGAKRLSEQLPLYFQRDTGEKNVPLKSSILVKHLLGKAE